MAKKNLVFPKSKIKVDELFKTQDEKNGAELSQISYIDIDSICDFPAHPFRVENDNYMSEMVKSVKMNGILNPAIVRKLENGNYQMISGHRRKEACKQAGLSSIPCIVHDLSDEEATVLMVDSNMTQREFILPSEKAFAYKMKLDAIKKNAGRPQKNLGQVDPNKIPDNENNLGQLDPNKFSRDQIAEETGESPKQISRYIRLTYLIPDLMKKVDDGKIKFIPAVNISFLNKKQQQCVDNLLDDGLKISVSQSEKLKKHAKENSLTENDIYEIFSPSSVKNKAWNLSMKGFKAYLPENIKHKISPDRASEILEEAMRLWNEKHGDN